MSQKVDHSSSQSPQDHSSGEDSDISCDGYVTASEELQDPCPKSVTSEDLSREESFDVSERPSCCGHCRIDAETQTSNCQFCRVVLEKQDSDVSSETDLTSLSTSYDGDTSSVSSLTTVTPSIRESDVGSKSYKSLFYSSV